MNNTWQISVDGTVRGLQLSEGNFMGFLTNPISGVFLAIAALSIAWQIYSGLRAKKAASLTDALGAEPADGIPDHRSGGSQPR